VVADHLETFLARATDDARGSLPRFVVRELRDFHEKAPQVKDRPAMVEKGETSSATLPSALRACAQRR
jgi:hypothetical protein